MTNLANQLRFGVKTKKCLQHRIFGTIRDLLCGESRENILERFLGFVIKNLATRNNTDSNQLEMMMKVIAPLINDTTKFEILLDQMCKKKTTSPSAVQPAREKRQFGLLDTLHLLKSVFCDEEIVGAAMKELQRRSNASQYVIYVISNCWCCLIMGEWDSIADNQQEN